MIFSNSCVTNEPLFKTTNAHYTYNWSMAVGEHTCSIQSPKPNWPDLSQKQNYEALTTSHRSLVTKNPWPDKMAGPQFLSSINQRCNKYDITTSKLLCPSVGQSIQSILTNYHLHSPAPTLSGHPVTHHLSSTINSYQTGMWPLPLQVQGVDIISSTQLC